jgi:alkanesulfonate monooxygenase SsuD/methylene tetrahydromethanopterin reductase-like flavin-dependent oxidoreductase (luciferase family)
MATDDNPTSGAAPRVTHPWVTAGRQTLRFGIGADPSWEWAAFLDTARVAEDLGFDSFWVSDHPMWLPDCWTTVMALAGATTRIRLVQVAAPGGACPVGRRG